MNFRRLLALLLTAIMMLGAAGCTQLTDQNGNPITQETPQSQTQLFDTYLNDSFLEVAGDNLLDSRFLVRYPENFGLTDVPKVLGSIDFDVLDNPKADWQKDYDELTAFVYNDLTPEQQMIYDLLLHDLEEVKPVVELSYYGEMNSPLLGTQTNLPSTLAEFRISTVQDAYDYVEMLGSTPDYFDQMLEYQRRRSAKGLFMPDSMLEETIQSCDNFVKNPEENMLLDTFTTRLDQIPDITPEEKNKLAGLNKKALLESVIPAYNSFSAGLATLKGTGKNTGGTCNLPQGKVYYEYLVSSSTGSEKSVRQLAKMLEQQLFWVLNRGQTLALKNPTVMGNYYKTKMDYGTPEEMLVMLREHANENFPPLTELAYQVKYVHPSMEEHSSPAFYFTPPVDAAGENSIYINRKYTTGEKASSPLYPTLAHEGYPGHMYQLNYFNEQKQNPIRKLLSYNGYIEGWASYVEGLSYNMGEITDPAVAELLQMDMMISLVISSRVDIGVNYEGWDIEETAAFLTDYGFDSPETVTGIFDAVVQNPANYLSYCVGMLEFKELRTYAESELGDAFEAKAFHKAVLDVGPAPFSFVKKAVKAYVAENTVSTSESASDGASGKLAA